MAGGILSWDSWPYVPTLLFMEYILSSFLRKIHFNTQHCFLSSISILPILTKTIPFCAAYSCVPPFHILPLLNEWHAASVHRPTIIPMLQKDMR